MQFPTHITTIGDLITAACPILLAFLLVGIPCSSHLSIVAGSWLLAHGISIRRMRAARGAKAWSIQALAEQETETTGGSGGNKGGSNGATGSPVIPADINSLNGVVENPELRLIVGKGVLDRAGIIHGLSYVKRLASGGKTLTCACGWQCSDDDTEVVEGAFMYHWQDIHGGGGGNSDGTK